MIWNHASLVKLPPIDRPSTSYELEFGLEQKDWNISRCKHCSLLLRTFDKLGYSESREFELLVCDCCGWWIIKGFSCVNGSGTGNVYFEFFWLYSSLKELDINNPSLDFTDINNYLVVDYERRYSFHPRKFEEYIQSIFKNLGHETEITSYSGDDGIDIFVCNANEGLKGIQVKRYKNRKIIVEDIRSFAGALVLNSITSGIFVTTSNFQSGAQKTVERFNNKGISIDLWDSKKLFDVIKVNSRNNYSKGVTNPFDELWENLKSRNGKAVPLNVVRIYDIPKIS